MQSQDNLMDNDDDFYGNEQNNQDFFSNDFNDFGGMNNDPPMVKNSDLLKELTDFDPAIQNKIRNWLGMAWDSKSEDYVSRYPPIINEEGARWCIGWLRTYQSKTNIITNLDRNELKNIKIEIVELCWSVFPTKFEDFEIKDSADQYRLSEELQHSAYLVLAGAGDGKYTKFLSTSVSRSENVQLSPENQRNVGNNNASNPLDSLKNALLGRK